MALICSLLLFALFFSNVMLGAFWQSQLLGDVNEMLTLLAASICFVVAILKREAKAKPKHDQ